MIPKIKHTRWLVVCNSNCDHSFEVEGEDQLDGAVKALRELGWDIALSPTQEDPEAPRAEDYDAPEPEQVRVLSPAHAV